MISRFNPASYPVQLTGVMVWFRNATSPAPFKITVRQDINGTANANNSTQAYLGAALSNPSGNGVLDSAYSQFVDLTSANLVFNSGDVYAGVTQNLALNGFVGLALDTNANLQLNDRSWISTSQGSQGSWTQFVNWSFIPSQLAITAYFNVLPNAIAEISRSSFKAYPNPVQDMLFLQSGENEKCIVSLFDIQGKMVKIFPENKLNAAGYDVSEIPPGFYIVELHSRSGVKHARITKL
jgi:hypothetical protein